MTISYSLAPNPKWYFVDLVGRPLGGGYFSTYSSLDNTLLNPVYQDAGGNFVWPYVPVINNFGKVGILIDENGTQGPFYFAFDTTAPTSLYYLEVYDSAGVLQWTIDNFSPGSGSGGGSIITTAIDLENLVVNNVMWRNTGATPVAPGTFLKLAPGAHAALANNAANTTSLYTGPDICFIKNNSAATDTISFPRFTLGSTPFTNDVTPVDYLNYTCTGIGASETVKCVQFPITQGVQNLSNQTVTVTIWARGNSGTTTLLLQWMQFFGDGGGGSLTTTTPIQLINLTSSWVKYVVQATIPSVSGDTLGVCGNDALFLQVQYPLSNLCNIDFQKPSIYLGSISPAQDYHSYDMIDGIINAQRIGYIMTGLDTVAPYGYLLMNDGTIGSSSSGASTRAHRDTFPLYALLWNNVTSQTNGTNAGGTGYAQLYDNAGVPLASVGASAVADFAANRRVGLTKILGRALASAGAGSGLTARALGQFLGEETHTLNIAEMPSHTHPYSAGAGSETVAGQGSTPIINNSANTGTMGGGGAHNNMQPSSFLNFFIKL
jgi:hypothetical protein